MVTVTRTPDRPAYSGVRSATLRRANLASVLSILRFDGGCSRSELVARTGLARSAVGSLIGELVDRELVIETGPAHGGMRGRPSAGAEVDTSRVGALAVEVGVDDLAVAFVNLRGEVCDMIRTALSRSTDAAAVVEQIGGLARQLGFEAGHVGEHRLAGIGVAAPGLVRSADGVVVAAPNLGWDDVALGRLLGTELGGDVLIEVGNEADLGALAESRFGAGVDADTLVYVAGEVGVGGGVMVEGRRLGGRSGFGGEVGHMPVNPAGRQCGCGAIGCWETEVGERVLLERAGMDPDGGGDAIQELVLAAERGEARALDALAEHAGWIGVGLTGLINVFDPDVVVLGGRFAEIWPHIGVGIARELERSSLGGQDQAASVVPAHLAATGRLVGAAELAFESLVDLPLSR